MTRQDPFGLGSVFVGLENFSELFADPLYIDSIVRTVIFCAAVGVLSMSVALLLAVFADHEIRGRAIYRTLLIWPYAIAPAISAVAVAVHPQSAGRLARPLVERARRAVGLHHQRRPGTADGGGCERLEAGELQLHLLPRRPAVDPARGHRGGTHGRRQGLAPLPHHHLSAAVAHHLLPAGGEPRLRGVRYVRHNLCADAWRARQGYRDAGH